MQNVQLFSISHLILGLEIGYSLRKSPRVFKLDQRYPGLHKAI